MNTAVIVRRIFFFIMLVGLSLFYLLVSFQGLESREGMEQATIGRELARNNGFKTKVIRPVAVWQSDQASEDDVTLRQAARDTYHSPFYPVVLAGVFKAIKAGDSNQWRMASTDTIYRLDRVVATVSVFCFLMAIGMNYFLISRIFDQKIAGVVAILMLLCDLYWQFSLSGLPQMLMLLLFSTGAYFAFRAVENTQSGKAALLPALGAAVFFGLLALTHWLALWIAVGFAVYAAFALRPRGLAGVSALIVTVLFVAYPLVQNVQNTGSIGGTAFLAIFNGLSPFGVDPVMRAYDLGDSYLSLQNLPFRILRASFTQANNLYSFLGAIPVAPLFFVALIHSFKRASIASFRWCLLLMWVFAVLGMAIFGIGNDPVVPNQIHCLFAPIMAAYGLAFVAIIWAKVQLSQDMAFLRSAPTVVIVIISSGPLLMGLPSAIRGGATSQRSPHWPPYYPPALNLRLASLTKKNEIVASDIPWAVAWYADRTSLWLPRQPAVFERIEDMAEDEGTPIAGILISPFSAGSQPLQKTFWQYNQFGSLILDGWASLAMQQKRPGHLAYQDRDMKALLARYPHHDYLNGPLLTYWSAHAIYEDGRR